LFNYITLVAIFQLFFSQMREGYKKPPAKWLCGRIIPIPIRNMEKDILKSAGFNAFSKCAYP